MPYIFLALATLLMSCSGICATFYNRRNTAHKDTAQIYNLIVLATVFLCWTIKFLTDPSYDWSVLPYSALFTVGYTTAMIATVYAYREGPIMLSSLIMQLSMISTTIWGFFFWDSEVTFRVILGLVLVVVALVLCLYRGKQNEGESKGFTAKWFLFIALFFIGNSVGSITQKTQQIDFEATYGDFFMMIATAVSFVACLVAYLKSNRSDTKRILKVSWYIPPLVGVVNFLLNLMVIILATLLSANIVYPVMMICSLAITSIFSIFIFKERMNLWQWGGVLLGAIAIALLC